MKYNDSWTAPLKRSGKKTISGGAARNVRISNSGGMDAIITDSVRYALNRANQQSNDVNNLLVASATSETEHEALH